MLKILLEKWDKNKDILKQRLMEREDLNGVGYRSLVELTFETIYNDNESEYGDKLNIGKITEIDDGDYQGTLLYLIPFDTYQPSASEYLMTEIGYGSCSGCDTLQGIQDWSQNRLTDEQVNDFMGLCKDILTSTIKPYNSGWRNESKFDNVVVE